MAKGKYDLSVSLGLDMAAFEKGLKAAQVSMEKSGKALESEAKQATDAIIAGMAKVGKSSTLKSASRQMDNLVATMHKMGFAGSTVFNETVKQAGNLKAELDDVAGFIKAARPDAPFQALNTTLVAGAQAFAGIQGAMALFGSESEEVQKILLKVQAAMALAEGFKAIDGLTDGFKQMGLVLSSKVIPALGTMKGALVATGIGALAVGIGLLISYFDGLADSAEEAAKAVDKAMDLEGDIHELNAMDLEARINRMKAAGKSEEKIFEERKRFQEQYIKDLQAAREEAGENGFKFNDTILKAEKQLAILTTAFAADQAEKRRDQEKKDQDERLAQQKEFSEKRLAEERRLAEEQENIINENLKDALAIQQDVADELDRMQLNEEQREIKDLQDKYNEQRQVLINANEDTLALTELFQKRLQAINDKYAKIYADQNKDREPMAQPGAPSEDNLKKIKKEMDAVDELNKFVNQSISNASASAAEAIGEAIVSGEDVGAAIGKSLLQSIGDFMQQLGKAMIAVGVSLEAFQKSLQGLQPEVALVAGIALVAAGAAVRSIASKGMQPAGMAEGGIVPGGFPNDTFPALLTSGEMVVPPHKLPAMGNGMQRVEVVGRFDGRDIYFAAKNYGISNNR